MNALEKNLLPITWEDGDNAEDPRDRRARSPRNSRQRFDHDYGVPGGGRMSENLRRDLEMSIAAEGWRIALERISEIDAGVRPGMDMREVGERCWLALQQAKDVAVQALTPRPPENKPWMIGEPTPTPPENPDNWQIWIRTPQEGEVSPQMFVWMRERWMKLLPNPFPLAQG